MTDKEWVPAPPEPRQSTHLYRNRTAAKVRRKGEEEAFKTATAASGEIIKAMRAPRPDPVYVREVSTDGKSSRTRIA